SFVNQIVDKSVPPEVVAADPFDAPSLTRPSVVTEPAALFAPERPNSRGWDLTAPDVLADLQAAMAPWQREEWQAGPILATVGSVSAAAEVTNPATGGLVGYAADATETDVAAALSAAQVWNAPAEERAAVLRRAADLYEAAYAELFACLTREAGKALPDAVAELREAVDFLRYYAARAATLTAPARGVITCVSPWNFPLAIFTGQIAAALAAGNAVLAKPAEATPLIASLGVRLLQKAGVPNTALQLLPGPGATVGAALTADPRVKGVAFTGSTATAQAIHRSMAAHLDPDALLIAETGGLNAMVVDSTALPEQAVRDILLSAFRSAGQRCSALRMLYVQDDIAESFIEMLVGAMDELRLGDPWDPATDIGPVIDEPARAGILAHISTARAEQRILHEGVPPEAGTIVAPEAGTIVAPEGGTFVAPTLIRVRGIEDLEREVFGPVLHLATFRAEDLSDVVAAVNASGYGLTFGIHSRIDDRVEAVTAEVAAGNVYVNRNQIGAIVGSQPFGGEGLSGTGPKAGGPHYVSAFCRSERVTSPAQTGAEADPARVAAALAALPPPSGTPRSTQSLPGPTGELNLLKTLPRGPVLCLGPSLEDARAQAALAARTGCPALTVCPGGDIDGVLPRTALSTLTPLAAVLLWAEDDDLRAARQALAARAGAILPLIAGPDPQALSLERHICVDTTAAGGNASLLAKAG
ncbi:MAG: L-glutamate gamma-semialdehyde dehydrogenase, partial [Pseudomonadota bacterium]